MSERGAAKALALAGFSLAVVVVALTIALRTESPLATGTTLGAMVVLAASLHAIGRTHPGP